MSEQLRRVMQSLTEKVFAYTQHEDSEAILARTSDLEIREMIQLLWRQQRTGEEVEEELLFGAVRILASVTLYRYKADPTDLRRKTAVQMFVSFPIPLEEIPQELRAEVESGRHESRREKEQRGTSPIVLDLDRRAIDSPESIDSAIEETRVDLQIAQTPEERVGELGKLASLHKIRHNTKFDSGDIDRAVSYARQAATEARGLSIHSSSIFNLGNMLRTRFMWSGDMDDLAEAIEHLSSAANDSEVSDHYRHTRLANLGEALTLKYATLVNESIVSSQEPLQEAQKYLERALRIDHPEIEVTRSFYADCLFYVAQSSHSSNDLESAAVACLSLHQDLINRPLDAALRQVTLAKIRLLQHQESPRSLLLDYALQSSRSAVRLARRGHSSWASAHLVYGETCRARFDTFDSTSDAFRAIDLFKIAASETHRSWTDALRAAAAWGELASRLPGMMQVAVEGYEQSIQIINELPWRGASRANSLRVLQNWAYVPREAASVLLESGDPVQALTLLDNGRAVLWNQVFQLKSELRPSLESFRDADIEYELIELRRQLREIEFIEHLAPSDRDKRGALTKRWATITWSAKEHVDPVHPLGYELSSKLVEAGSSGPVVVLNTSTSRCDAIVLWRSYLSIVELIDLTGADVTERTVQYLSALLDLEAARRALPADHSGWQSISEDSVCDQKYSEVARELLRAQEELDSCLTDVLDWLWVTVSTPILNFLGILTSAPSDSSDGATEQFSEDALRLWWCPTGDFALLPLHAAQPRTGGDSVLDRVLSSYTPTISGLLEARGRAARGRDYTSENSSLLFVLADSVEGEERLDGAQEEKRHLSTELGSKKMTTLEGGNATRSKVKSALSHHKWVHVSSHGFQDLLNPLQGGVALTDGLLTVGELMNEDVSGHLAFLSACQTAVGGSRTPDEGLSLATALFLTGFDNVIGTVWTVTDSVAATVAISFYNHVIASGEPDASKIVGAFGSSIRQLRASGARPSDWVPFIHLGV